jgi:hypothetical protein
MPSDFSRIQDNVQSMVDQSASPTDIAGYLNTEGFSPQEFKLANENFGTFTSAVKRGGKGIGSLIADVLPAMGADLVEKIAPESFKPAIKAYKEKQMGEAQATQEQIAKTLPAEFESYKDVGGAGDAFGYAKEAVGESLASLLPGLITGGVGSVASRGAILAAGEMARTQAAKSYLASQAAKNVPVQLAERRAAEVGLEAAKAAMAKKATQYEVGSTLAGSAALNVPDTYQALYDPNNQETLVPALMAGAFNTALDAVTPFNLLRTIKGKGVTSEALGAAWYLRGAKGLGTGVLTEGTTEALQEMTTAKAEQIVKDHPEFFTPENLTRFIDAGLKGGIGGGAIQGATSTVFGKGPTEKPGVTPPPAPGTEPTAGPTLRPDAVEGEQGTLFGTQPEGRLPDRIEPVFKSGEVEQTETPEGTITNTGKIQGYTEAGPLAPEKELTGEQTSLLPESPQGELPLGGEGQIELKRGELRNIEGERIDPLRNEQGEVISEKTKPIGDVASEALTQAKQDPTASKQLKGNNPATVKDIVSRVQALIDSGLSPAEAIEQVYMQGRYDPNVKGLSDAKLALLDDIYARITNGGNIEDSAAVRSRSKTLGEMQQAELFPEGDQNAAGKTEPTTGTTGTNVGVPGGPDVGTTGGVGGSGIGGLGVDGSGIGTGGSTGRTGPKPTTLTPEQAWNFHKNDDHPEFNALSSEEQTAWGELVAAGRGNVVDFQNLMRKYEKRTKQEEVTNKKIDEKTLTEYDAELRTNIDKQLSGKHAAGVMNFLMNNGPKANQEIAKAVNKRIEDMKAAKYNFTFNIVNQPSAGWRGEMDPYKIHGTMQVRLNRAADGLTYRTATHEFIHAAGFALIDYGRKHPKTKEGKVVAELGALQKYVVKYLQDKQKADPDSLNQFEKDLLKSRTTTGYGNALGLFQFGRLHHEIDELTTWGLTDGNMIAVLDSIPYKNTTVGQKVVELIRKLLGISNKHDTAFNELLRLTNELFDLKAADTGIIPLKETQPLQTGALSDAVAPKPTGKAPERLTKTEPGKTSGEKTIETAKNIYKEWNDSSWWTKFRIAAIDPTASLAKTLNKLPIFQDGQLRADMLARSFSQVVNLIKNGLQSGIPVLNSDGTISIMRSENNMARSQLLADELDNNAFVKSLGISGRTFAAEIARAKRGEEILAEDEAVREQARKNMAIAKAKMDEAKRAHKNGEPRSKVRKLENEAAALRNKWRDAVNLNREIQVTPEHIAQANAWMKAVPEVTKIFDIWQNINMGLIDLNEATGNYSKEKADHYRSKRYYVPLSASRVDIASDKQESYTNTRKGAKSVAKEYRLEGSDLQRNIWENMDKYYAAATASAYQNQTRKVAVRQLMSAGIDGAKFARHDDDKVNLRYLDPDSEHADGNGVVSVIVDNPNDVAAFQIISHEMGPLMKGISATTQVLRAGALVNPMYWIKQLIRDPIHASLVANAGIVTPFHSAKEYFNVLANNSEEARILASRGVIGQVDSTMDLAAYLNQVGTEKVDPSRLQKMLHKVMQLHEASDAATRVAIYKQVYAAAIKQGLSKEDATNLAVHKAREAINFAVHGNSKTLNTLRHMIPFFSAALNSLDTVYRAATGYGLNPEEKKAAQTLFAKRAAMMTMLSLVYAMMLQDDEDYKKLPDNVKDNNWLLPSPVGDERSFLKIPVPFEIGFLFKTLPEVSVRYMADTSTGKEVLASILSGIKHNLPGELVPLPQAIKPGLEAITNYSFFTGRPIEGMSDQGLPVAARGPNASEFAKSLSSFGLDKIGLSPAKIDYLIQGYTAELGATSANIASGLINAATGKEPPDKNLEQQPFFKSFLTNPNTSKAASDYYDLSHNAQEAVNYVNRLKKEGRIAEAKEYMSDEEHKKLVAAAPAYRRVGEQMAKVRAEINRIKGDVNRTGQSKQEEINRLQGVYDRIARQGYKIAEAAGIER